MNEGAAASVCALNDIQELELEGKKVVAVFITSQSISILRMKIFLFQFYGNCLWKGKII
jgi:hypothetical protein